MTSLEIAQSLRYALVGALAFTIAFEVLLGRFYQRRAEQRTVILFSAAVAVFVVGRIIQHGASDVDVIRTGVRIQFVAALGFVPVTFAMLHAMAGRTLPRAMKPVVAATALVALASPLAGPLLVDDLAWIEDPWGNIYPAAGDSALSVLVAPYAVVCVGGLAWTYLRFRRDMADDRRRSLAILLSIIGVATANDMMVTRNLIASVHVMDFALSAHVLFAIYVVVHRTAAIHTDLQNVVASRTAELEAQSVQLTGAVRTFRALIDGIPDTVLVHRDGEILFVNPAGCRYFGYTQDELEGSSVGALFVDRHRDKASRALREMQSADQATAAVEAEFSRKDGAIVTGEMQGLAVEHNGQPAAVTIIRDVGERKAMQAQLLLADRLASVGTMAAGIAHEINNPLSFIIANVQSASEELADLRKSYPDAELDDVREMLADAADGADRVRVIVRDMRIFARADDKARRGPVNIGSVLQLAANMARNEIRHRARLIVELGTVPRVWGNEARLSQVFVNLLLNAAQAIPAEEGEETHEIRVLTRAGDDGQVVVEIEDTGAGVPEDIKQRIFDPFFTTKPVGEGTGLGLSICHSIVSAHEGRLELLDREGGGTIARVTLPASDDRRPATAPSLTTELVVGERAFRILIVDDEPQVGRSMRRMLKRHEVTLATTGAQALALCDARAFDAILCDLMMSGLSGMDVYERLRDRAPETAERMIFMTGGAFTPRAIEFLRKVPNPKLEKPVDRETLLSHVRQVAGASDDDHHAAQA